MQHTSLKCLTLYFLPLQSRNFKSVHFELFGLILCKLPAGSLRDVR